MLQNVCTIAGTAAETIAECFVAVCAVFSGYSMETMLYKWQIYITAGHLSLVLSNILLSTNLKSASSYGGMATCSATLWKNKINYAGTIASKSAYMTQGIVSCL